MSLLLLIDGYNVLAPSAPPRSPDPMWLHRERAQLLERLATHLPGSVRQRTQVVFDAANPPRDRPDRFVYQDIDVQFAVNYPEADDLLEEIIRGHSSPKQLAVVSSDHRVQTAASRRSAEAFDSQSWLDSLLDGNLRLSPRANVIDRDAGEGRGDHGDDGLKLKAEDVNDWMDEFGF
ncbi:NYN domain-containing protein [Rubripirellula amarantea]|nr:NYN domain-containing protein [Rubripirellula amarantea]